MTQRTMKHLVRIIHVKNYLYFTKDELDVLEEWVIINLYTSL